jgi:hypothetical protein
LNPVVRPLKIKFARRSVPGEWFISPTDFTEYQSWNSMKKSAAGGIHPPAINNAG